MRVPWQTRRAVERRYKKLSDPKPSYAEFEKQEFEKYHQGRTKQLQKMFARKK